MMFNSINNDINNYNSIPYKRQYVKQPASNSHLPYRQSFSSTQNLGHLSSSYGYNRQSPYLKGKQQMPINENNFYKQKYEVNSPFEENLRHSDVRSYTSQQYYPNSQSDKLSQNSNKWSRNTASYFPTSPLFNRQQFSSVQYQSGNQNYTQSSNPFKKHSQKRPVYNFDSFQNKSKSRIKEMNKKIDLTTKSILKNGLIHQKQVLTSAIVRSSSKQQRSREKRQYQSPRNQQPNLSRFSSDKKNHSSIERKKQYPVNNNSYDFQRQVYAHSKVNSKPNEFQFSKPQLIQSNNYERLKPDRMPAFEQQFKPNINSPFQSNIRMKEQQIFNSKGDETIDFMDFQDNNKQTYQKQKIYRLPSTQRKDITFNQINKDHILSKEITRRDEFSSLRSNDLQLNKPILYTSQSQQTFNKSKNVYPSHQQPFIDRNIVPQFQLKPYTNSRMHKQKSSNLLRNTNQFQSTDLIVLNKNRSNQKIQQRIPSRTRLDFNNDNFQNNNSNSKRNQYKFGSNPSQMKSNFINSQSSRYSNNNPDLFNQQPFKRTSSFQNGLNYFEFQNLNQNQDKFFIDSNNQIKSKKEFQQHRNKYQNYEFQDFQNQNGSYNNFQFQNLNVETQRQKLQNSDKKINQNIKETKQILIEDNKILNKAVKNKIQSKDEEEFPTIKTISAPKTNILQNYMSNMKDKQSQVIAISLITLAVVILIIQLAS